MTFLGAINRILRITTIMQWDDDDITAFSSTQHAATISLARQAVQHVTNDLISDAFLFPEDAQDNITTVASTRTYSLASDFVRFQGTDPQFQHLTGIAGTDADGQFLMEYPGGENKLKKEIPAYTSQTGTPQWYYFTGDQEIGIYPVPGTVEVYRYDYQKDVMPENEADTLPVQSEQMAYAYVDMSARVFSLLFTRQPVDLIEQDVIYKRAKGALFALNRKADPINKYGFSYR